MKVFFRYLCLVLKRSTLQSMIFTLIALLFMFIQLPELTKPDIITENVMLTTGYEEQTIVVYSFCMTGMHLLAFILGTLATVIPFLCLSEFKSRRNSDTIYSLPISRFKLCLAHFASGFIQIVFIYTCTFFTTFLYLFTTTDYFKLSNMLIYYPLSLLAAFMIYSFFAFLITKANTRADGVIISIMWFSVICLLFNFLKEMFGFFSYSFINRWSLVYSPLNNLTKIFMKRTEIFRDDHLLETYYEIINETNYMFVFWAIIGILCTVGFFISASRYKSNKAGEISDSIFAYKLLIPLVGITFFPYFYDSFDFRSSSLVFVVVTTFIMYIVYRRSFRLKKQDYIIWASIFVWNIVMCIF